MTTDDIKKAVRDVLEEEHKLFWVSPETHYQHHEWVKGWIKTTNIAKKSIIVAFAAGLVSGLLGIIWLGIQVALKIKGAMTP